MDIPKKKVDESWKARARKEKEDLTKKIEGDCPAGPLDEIFLQLLQDLMMQTMQALQSGDLDTAKKFLMLFDALEHKTQKTQTLKDKEFFTNIAELKQQLVDFEHKTVGLNSLDGDIQENGIIS